MTIYFLLWEGTHITLLLSFAEVQENGTYIFLSTITYSEGKLKQTVVHNGYQDISQLKLKTVRLFGASSTINTILVNGERHTDFEILLPGNELQVHNLNIPVNSEYIISFSTESTGTTVSTASTGSTGSTTSADPTGSSSVLFTFSWILFYAQLSYTLFIFVKTI